MTESIFKELVRRLNLKSLLCLLFLFLPIKFYNNPKVVSVAETIKTIVPQKLQPAIKAELIGIILAFSTYIIFGWIENRKKLYFGLYWNKQGVPFCPNCRNALIQIEQRSQENMKSHALRCQNKNCCNEPITIRTDKGEAISLKEAKRRLNMKSVIFDPPRSGHPDTEG